MLRIKTIIKIGIIGFYLQACETRNPVSSAGLLKASKQMIGDEEYLRVWKLAEDSLKNWIRNGIENLGAHDAQKNFVLDSLFCINSNKDRLLGVVLNFNQYEAAREDGFDFFYGENINGKWYFWRKNYYIIPRSMFENQPNEIPLSYQQLHHAAVKYVFSGYLNKKGEIDEEWFINYFEGPGYGHFNDPETTTRYLGLPKDCVFTDKTTYFKAIHLQGVKNLWQGVKKDSVEGGLNP